MRETKLGKIHSPLHADLDRITDGIVESLGVDMALFSVSSNNSLISLGLSESIVRMKDMRVHDPADLICNQVIQSNAPLVVPDARTDPQTSGNRHVREGLVAGYIGVPIQNAEVGAIGALCGITTAPRNWSDSDLRYLSAVALGIENLILREMYRLECADVSNLASEYDKIIAAFSLVRAEPTSIHDGSGRLVFANKALMEYVNENDLQTAAVTSALLETSGEATLQLGIASGARFSVTRVRTSSGYYVCHWAPDDVRLN